MRAESFSVWPSRPRRAAHRPHAQAESCCNRSALRSARRPCGSRGPGLTGGVAHLRYEAGRHPGLCRKGRSGRTLIITQSWTAASRRRAPRSGRASCGARRPLTGPLPDHPAALPGLPGATGPRFAPQVQGVPVSPSHDKRQGHDHLPPHPCNAGALLEGGNPLGWQGFVTGVPGQQPPDPDGPETTRLQELSFPDRSEVITATRPHRSPAHARS
jgi:hypothetical protein